MTDPKSPEAHEADRTRLRVRKSYEAPRVVESAAFETLAMACAMHPGEALCDEQSSYNSR